VVAASELERARGAREVVLAWEPLEWLPAATLVEVRPVTGFLHQIRAVFAHLGYPLVGDATYASRAVADAAPRHLLHASALRFEEVVAESPDPEDFASWLSAARES
jgi:23S rRNA-/tRNA-specific pseudouridylate synthase